MIKKNIILALTALFICFNAHSQIWDSRLGMPAEEYLAIGYTQTSLNVPFRYASFDESEKTDIISKINSKLTEQGFNNITATSITGKSEGNIAFRCATNLAREVIIELGYKERKCTIYHATPNCRITTVSPARQLLSEASARITVNSSTSAERYRIRRKGDPLWLPAAVSGNNGTLTLTVTRPGTYYVLNDKGAKMTGECIVEPSSAYLAANSNYVNVTTYLDANQTVKTEDITFYNGLGLPEQLVNVKASPTGKNVVTPVYYDPMLRDDVITYLPYMSSKTSAEKDPDPFTAQESYYSTKYAGETNFYYQTVQEASPLARVKKVFNTGKRYRLNDKYVSMDYLSNSAGEVLRFTVPSGGVVSEVTVTGHYESNTLVKTVTTDEEGGQSIVFQDQIGNTILERRLITAGQYADTYYVYDDHNRVRLIISPEASKRIESEGLTFMESGHDILTSLCYEYNYDDRGRVSDKILPGCSRQFFIYDDKDRMVMTQDGKLAGQGRWIIFRYDAFNRIVRQMLSQTGIVMSTARQQAANGADLCDLYGAYTLQFHHFGSHYRTGLKFAAVSGVVAASDRNINDKAWLTYEELAVVDGPDITSQPQMVARAMYYDKKGRIIQIVESNHLGYISRYSFKYDFVGNVITRHESHAVTPDETHSLTVAYTYDDRGRILTEQALLNNGAKGVVNYVYDDLGRLSGKKYGEGAAQVAEQYAYNIQGWQTDRTSTLFESELDYNYNGNIEKWTFRHPGEDYFGENHMFKPRYDKLGRITEVWHDLDNSTENTYYERNITYDRNGNIKTLDRTNGPVNERLAYAYDGNKVINVNELESGGAYGYSYDNRGNVTKDGINGVDIDYNYLNLVSEVKNNNVPKGSYTWLSDGRKVGASNGSLAYNSTCGFPSSIHKEHNAWTNNSHINTRQDIPVAANGFSGAYQRFEVAEGVHESGMLSLYNIHVHWSQLFREGVWVTVEYRSNYDILTHTLYGFLLPANEGEARTATFFMDSSASIVTTPYTTDAWLEIRTVRMERATHGFEYLGSMVLRKDSRDNVDFPTSLNNEQTVWNTNSYTYNTVQDIGIPASGFSGPYRRFEVIPGTSNHVSLYNRLIHTEKLYEGGVWVTMEYRSNYEILLYGTEEYLLPANTGNAKKVTFLMDGSSSIITPRGNDDGWLEVRTLAIQKLEEPELRLESAAFGGGRLVNVDGTVKPHYYLTDHLGSTRVVFDNGRNVLDRVNYLAFGQPWLPSRYYEFNSPGSRYLFNGMENQSEFSLDANDHGARMSFSRDGRWHNMEPLAEKYPWMSPYAFSANNPLKYVDPDGFSPIYDPDGNFLGTDDDGLTGQPIVMLYDNFSQNMTNAEALQYNLGMGGFVDAKSYLKFDSHYKQLSLRPDWDGYLTLEEANDWYRNGNGETLYVDLRKIDLKRFVSLGDDYIGEKYNINLLWKSKDGLVYGNVKFIRTENDGVRAYSDKYDFDMHSGKSLDIKLRNTLTKIGEAVAGKGTPYEIIFYGTAQLKPKP